MECSSDKVYAKVIKKTLRWASEESFTISAGNAVEFVSPPLAENEERVMEMCLSITNNHVYTLKMKDSRNDSWSDGAWIAIEDSNEHIIFKNMMTAKSNEETLFALYSPISKNGEWKMEFNFQSGWNQFSFDDSAWSSYTHGSTTQQSSGTLYFRKTFAGVTGMAAVDIQFRYAHGILAFINGVEVFRDNLPSGAVSPTTPASGSYTTSDYHGVIRPAAVAEAGEAVLAVELHFTDASSRPVDFDAFLSYGSGISSDNKCFVSYAEITATSPNYANIAKVFDYTRNSGATALMADLPHTFFVSFGNVVPIVNGLRIYAHLNPGYCPSSFLVEGGDSPAATSWTPIIGATNQEYTYMAWSQLTVMTEPAFYKTLRGTIRQSQGISTYLYEIQFLVCNNLVTTVSYPEESYSFYARYDPVHLEIVEFGITHCQIQPALPDGLLFDTSSCAITGSAVTGSPETTYSLTATAGTRSLTGTVRLTFLACEGTLLRVVRSYQFSPEKEAFRIRDTSNDAVLLEVPLGNTLPASQEHVDYLCVDAERFDVTVDGSGANWSYGSYLSVFAVLADGEEELMLKTRFDAQQGNDATFYLRRPSVGIKEQWFYRMGDIPSDWFNEDTSGWSVGQRDSFPEAPNQLQLYKHTFPITNRTLVSGVILNVRYRDGVIVYLNGQEAFRNHVVGALSPTLVATGRYDSLRYRTVTIPGRFVFEDASQEAVSLLKQGTNVIAIAVIGSSAVEKTSVFDATLRLMTREPESHLWESSMTSTGLLGPASSAFDGDHSTSINYPYCGENSLVVTLDNDRREWVNMVQIQNDYASLDGRVAQFDLFGKNAEDAEWTLLRHATNVTYSMAGQRRNLFFINNRSFNQFKFANFATGGDSCPWRVQSLNLFAVSVMTPPTELAYPASSSVYKDIEMSEIIPEGEGYFDFAIRPTLPLGIVFDPTNGWIHGTAHATTERTTYTVTAKRITGGSTSVSFSLAVEICTGGKSLMTVRIAADDFPSENAWKLFQGRGVTGSLLQSVDVFPVSSSYYYLDFCLRDGLYTFQGIDTFGDGWASGSGYTLTADMGAMELEVEELYGAREGTVRSVTTVFSSFFPFQVEYSNWKVYQGEKVDGWNGVGFDDAAWETKKAAEIVNGETVTTYLRKSFQLTGIDDYQVLNIRMKYAGGVVVYFNGNKVARFNLIEDFDANTESIEIHDATLFSKFHIIVPTSGVQEGTNVVAFEIHRPVGTSSSAPFVFDATGVFGVNDCSTTLDSFSFLNATQPVTGTLASLLDLDPATVAAMPQDPGTFIEWTVENLEGSRWNAFNILGASTVDSWNMELTGTLRGERVTLLSLDTTIHQRTKPQIAVPVALAGFRHLRYETLGVSSSDDVGALFTAYCRGSGGVCPGVDAYPSVAEGQLSPALCPEGFTGFSYRRCSGGVLGEVQLEHCSHKAPSDLRYRLSRFVFVKDTVIAETPSVRNVVTRWYMDAGARLPAGLTLNELTGEIAGVPTETSDAASYTIRAENPTATIFTVLEIRVREGQCLADGLFPVTSVGEEAVLECGREGSYVGTQRRRCELGEKDGEWQKITGVCVSMVTVVFMILVALAVVAIVVFIAVRTRGRTKAVGGVKGKKTVKKAETAKKVTL